MLSFEAARFYWNGKLLVDFITIENFHARRYLELIDLKCAMIIRTVFNRDNFFRKEMR